jgi:hypothetical protein
MIKFEANLPEGDVWHRHIVCQGMEINCYTGWTAQTFGECEKLTVSFRTFKYTEFPKTEEGLRDLRNFLWNMETVFHAGAEWRFREVQKALGIKS